MPSQLGDKKLLSRDPTQEMHDAGMAAKLSAENSPSAIYRAMYDAALASQSLEREGEIRRAVIEECARELDNAAAAKKALSRKYPATNSASEWDDQATLLAHMAKLLRALAQQPPAGEKE